VLVGQCLPTGRPCSEDAAYARRRLRAALSRACAREPTGSLPQTLVDAPVQFLASLGVDLPEEEVATPEETEVVRGEKPALDDTPEDGSGMVLGVAGRLRRYLP